MTREQELAREGWSKRTTYDEPRLSELVATYEEVGYEVLLEPFRPDDEPTCDECMKAEPGRFKTVYVRRKPDVPDGD